MANLNRVELIGRLGQDPELKYTQNQIAVCSLALATTEYSKDADGNKKESTEWHKVILWRSQAENASKFLKKGSIVFIEGKLQTRSWDDKNGEKRYTTEIVANNIQFLDSKKENSVENFQDFNY